MQQIRLSLLRGVCQVPAYVACARQYFQEEGLDAEFSITPTAWLVPEQLAGGTCDFAVIPWTRVAVAEPDERPLRVVCGSGYEEAALVVRQTVRDEDVRAVAVPREGGMKDLTAMALIKEMGWEQATQLRYPSGDGAIIALFGGAADAASMVEPYATMFEMAGTGRVVRRTGDVWVGAPGCSLACAASTIESDPELVRRVVRAYVRAVDHVVRDPADAAGIAAPLVGVEGRVIAAAIRANPPRIDGIRNHEIMQRILGFMKELGYADRVPEGYADLRFMDAVRHGVTT